MLVEKNSSTKIIEDRMNFKFEELELVGKYDGGINERLIYKYNDKLYFFILQDKNMINTISEVKLQKEYDHGLIRRFIVNNTTYYFIERKVFFINQYQNYNEYSFFDNENKDNNYCFISKDIIKLLDEEAVVIQMVNSFLENVGWRSDFMIIKENEITKLIEDKMEFKFEDLELVGKFNKYVSSCFKIAFYKYKEDFFMFSIYKLKEITSIIKLGSLEMVNNKFCYNFFYNNKYYTFNYKTKFEMYQLHEKNTYVYRVDDSKYTFFSEKNVEIEKEEALILKLIDDFLDNNQLIGRMRCVS